tara:strand:+ start:20657 stop:20836 length:180 start_codon:yes stop_codon:yes gene_type:complete
MSISDGFDLKSGSGLSLNIQAFHGAQHGVDGAVNFISGADATMANDMGGNNANLDVLGM